jgi:hypothetical protein
MTLLVLLAADGTRYNVSLADEAPPPRYGGAEPWTHVRWERSPSRAGAWTEVETQALDPVAPDPADPPSYNLTTTIEDFPGWVRLVWLTDSGVQEPTEPVFVGSAIRPTVQEIANLMPDRLTLADGTEATTFTDSTRPTATQVEALIDLVLDTVDTKVPSRSSTELQRAARSIVALETAILAEATYFSHQGEVNTARIEVWERLIEKHAAALDEAAQDDPGPDDRPLEAGYASAAMRSNLVDAAAEDGWFGSTVGSPDILS